MNNKEEKFCGECCWFFGENIDGEGFCAKAPVYDNIAVCSGWCDKEYVSRQEMRHHMWVILDYLRDEMKGEHKRYEPWPYELVEPLDFAYRYMKTFSKL